VTENGGRTIPISKLVISDAGAYPGSRPIKKQRKAKGGYLYETHAVRRRKSGENEGEAGGETFGAMVSCFMASKMGEIVANEASDAGTFHPSRLEAGIAAQIKTRKKLTTTRQRAKEKGANGKKVCFVRISPDTRLDSRKCGGWKRE